MSLDAIERAAKVNPVPPRGRRHRLEHIETVDPADIPRFGALGVIASQQPFHGTPVAEPDDRVDGQHRRVPRVARVGLPLDHAARGGRLAFGSDWPVVTLDPRPGIHTAVTRTTIDGQPEEGWYPAERIPLAAGPRRVHVAAPRGHRSTSSARARWRVTCWLTSSILSSDIFAARRAT